LVSIHQALLFIKTETGRVLKGLLQRLPTEPAFVHENDSTAWECGGKKLRTRINKELQHFLPHDMSFEVM
jgi:hypothetical protein